MVIEVESNGRSISVQMTRVKNWTKNWKIDWFWMMAVATTVTTLQFMGCNARETNWEREWERERERERVRVTLLIQFYPHLMIFKNRNLFLASPIPGGGRSGDHFWMNRGWGWKVFFSGPTIFRCFDPNFDLLCDSLTSYSPMKSHLKSSTTSFVVTRPPNHPRSAFSKQWRETSNKEKPRNEMKCLCKQTDRSWF